MPINFTPKHQYLLYTSPRVSIFSILIIFNSSFTEYNILIFPTLILYKSSYPCNFLISEPSGYCLMAFISLSCVDRFCFLKNFTAAFSKVIVYLLIVKYPFLPPMHQRLLYRHHSFALLL